MSNTNFMHASRQLPPKWRDGKGMFYKRVCGKALVVIVATLASACSSLHDYTNSTPSNLAIKPDVRSGSARLDVYDVDSKCNATYQGTVELDGVKVSVGVPISRLSYLEFIFSDSSIFTGSRSISTGIYLTPRAGYQYDADISYIDKMYSATIYEKDMHGSARHEVPRIVPRVCANK